jgi:hypothetical protein
MARTVDSPIKLPGTWAAPGVWIANSTGTTGETAQAGTEYIGRALNTLWEQHRGQLVSDYNPDAILPTDNTTLTARYRVPVWGRGSLTETAKVYVYVTNQSASDTARSTTVTVGSVGTLSNVSRTFTDTGGALIEGWFELTSGTLSVEDTDDVDDIQMVMTTGANPAGVTVYGLAIVYNRTRTTLDALAAGAEFYTGTSFAPLDTAIMGDNQQLGPGLVMQLHENIRELYRRTGPALTSAFPNDITTETDPPHVWRLRVPETVRTLHLQLYGDTNGYSIRHRGTITQYTLPASSAWVSHELNVAGLTTTDIRITVTAPSGGGIEAISAYWGERQING